MTSLTNVSRQAVPPATRLEHKLYPWVYFLILPLFALTNADVSFVGDNIVDMLSSPVIHGVLFGLLLGKPIGIMAFSFLTVKLKIAKLPENVNWIHMLGASILGGVGFTMAIFVANLAYAEEIMVAEAKLAILLASLFAGVIGFIFLFIQASATKKQGVQYVVTKKHSNMSYQDTEAAERTDAIVAELADEEIARQIDDERNDVDGMHEITIKKED